MPDTLKTPSPLELCAELEEMVRRDLLGPAGGSRVRSAAVPATLVSRC